MIPPLTDRISLLEHVNSRYPSGIGVEIGMASGCFTKQILATWKSLKTLYCIDAWTHQPNGYDDPCNLDQATQDERYQRVLLDFKDEPKVKIIKGFSFQVSANFPPTSVDVIYLDANHTYEASSWDLAMWWDIVKPGGIFAGHDYRNGDKNYEVKKAVDEFAEHLKLPVHLTTQEFCRNDGVYGKSWEGYSFVLEKP